MIFFIFRLNSWLVFCETALLRGGLLYNVSFFKSLFQFVFSSIIVTSLSFIVNAAITKTVNPFNNNLLFVCLLEFMLSFEIKICCMEISGGNKINLSDLQKLFKVFFY